MKIPRFFNRGEIPSASHLNEIIKCLRSLIPSGDSKSIRVSRTPGGCTFSAIRQSGSAVSDSTSDIGGAKTYYCKTFAPTSTMNGLLYRVHLYEDPYSGYVGTGYALPLMVLPNEILPTGTWFLAHESSVTAMAVKQ